MSVPATPTSLGHLDAVDIVLVARADELRARDRRVARGLRFVAKWVAILALPTLVVAALFAPCCNLHFTCRSKQSEAKGNLKAIFVAEESFRAERGHYTDDPGELAWEPKGAKIRYTYLVRVNDRGNGFTAIAVGTADPMVLGDSWQLTQQNRLENVVNSCR